MARALALLAIGALVGAALALARHAYPLRRRYREAVRDRTDIDWSRVHA